MNNKIFGLNNKINYNKYFHFSINNSFIIGSNPLFNNCVWINYILWEI